MIGCLDAQPNARGRARIAIAAQATSWHTYRVDAIGIGARLLAGEHQALRSLRPFKSRRGRD
jgi:hypothetical protein